ncbi:hypothetical protein NSA50_17985 [Clostridium sp. DSM 100503]|uniref:hypothetical protein n=1 Tax=Clostridium sp. DSM 100503 TaxID=2963282 RepID=UPI002149FDDB|nr:hypothetical protein [Clostridium sp. DSM 100503]MCR1952895.1 hypothetical protein [Clostridium sp. DSM 100503]
MLKDNKLIKLNNTVTLNNLTETHIIELSESCNKELIKTQKKYFEVYKNNISINSEKISNK